MRLPHFPADESKERQERKELGKPEGWTGKKRRKRLLRGRKLRQLIKNILLLRSGLGGCGRRRCGICGRGSRSSRRRPALHPHRDWIPAQSYILTLDRIEIGKKLARNLLFALIRTDHGLECFRAAASDIVVLFEIGRGRILVPSVLLFEGRSRYAIEIPAPGNFCGDGNRIAHLHGFRVSVGGHREIADRAAE